MVEEDEGRGTPEAEGEKVDPLTMGELITLLEAARLSGLAVASLQKYAQQGKLRARKLGRDWATTAEAVRVYLDSRSVENIPKRHRREP